MSDVKLSLSQRQYLLLIGIMQSLPRALSVSSEEIESPPDTPTTASVPPTPLSEKAQSEAGVDLEPELSVTKSSAAGGSGPWTSLDLDFSVNSIALELYAVDAHEHDDFRNNSIARFALEKTHAGMKQLSDGSMEANFSLKTLSFANTRSGNSVFRDIIPTASHDGNQM